MELYFGEINERSSFKIFFELVTKNLNLRLKQTRKPIPRQKLFLILILDKNFLGG